MKSFILLLVLILSIVPALSASMTHAMARNCYQSYLNRYIQEHDEEEDYLYTLSNLPKEEIKNMFKVCKVKDDTVISDMLKLAIANDFLSPISSDYLQAEEPDIQKSAYSNLKRIYGRFSSENGININFPSFKDYQQSEISRTIGMTLTELRGKTAETYQYLVDQSKTLKNISDQQIEILLDNLLFQYGTVEACQSYCPLIFHELRKILLNHPEALLRLSQAYSKNKFIWLNINNDFYTGVESLLIQPAEEDLLDAKKKQKTSVEEIEKIPNDPRCDTHYLISSELYKIQQNTSYIFLITDKCENKISLKSMSNKAFSFKLEIKNRDDQLRYVHVFTGENQINAIKLIREALK